MGLVREPLETVVINSWALPVLFLPPPQIKGAGASSQGRLKSYFYRKTYIICDNMSSLTLSTPIIKSRVIIKSHLRDRGFWKVHRPPNRSIFSHTRLKILPLLCTEWKGSSIVDAIDAAGSPEPSSLQIQENTNDNDDSIIKGSNVVDAIDAEGSPELSSFQTEEEIIEMKNQSPLQQQALKWPMWLLGPSVLLATGMVPTLWLPLSAVFLGPNVAGLLSLIGLDCIFNMGATLFLLMADSCARPNYGERRSFVSKSRVPLSYRLWNLGASLLGFLVPVVMLMASYRGTLKPHLPFISFAVLIGPYLLLLSVQVLTEMLTWHWKSPVWLLTPIVYEVYRVLQLMRGVRLGGEIGAPGWAVESIRWLVSWWVLVLGIQLMRVAWFAGLESQTKYQNQIKYQT